MARTASRLLQGLGAAAPGTRSAAGLCSCEPVFTHPAAVGVAWAGQPLGKEVWLRRARPALCAAGHATGCADGPHAPQAFAPGRVGVRTVRAGALLQSPSPV